MALRIGGIPVLLGPSDIADGIRGVLGWTDDATALVAALPARIERLLADAETLIATMNALVVRAEELIGSVTAVTTTAETVIAQTTVSVSRADEAIAGAATTIADATKVLALYEPIAERAAPMARQFVEEFSADELHAAIRMVDQIPRLTAHVEDDLLPLLQTLDHVGPDLRELISVVTDVRNAVSGLPGISLLRSRGASRRAPRPDPA